MVFRDNDPVPVRSLLFFALLQRLAIVYFGNQNRGSAKGPRRLYLLEK